MPNTGYLLWSEIQVCPETVSRLTDRREILLKTVKYCCKPCKIEPTNQSKRCFSGQLNVYCGLAASGPYTYMYTRSPMYVCWLLAWAFLINVRLAFAYLWICLQDHRMSVAVVHLSARFIYTVILTNYRQGNSEHKVYKQVMNYIYS